MSKLAPEERAVRLEAYEKKSTLIESGRLMRKQSKEAQQMVMKDELRRMKRGENMKCGHSLSSLTYSNSSLLRSAQVHGPRGRLRRHPAQG